MKVVFSTPFLETLFW